MNETKETQKQSILDNPSLKENPFRVPQGYFSSIEESVKEKIHAPQTRFEKWWTVAKPSLVLAASFALLVCIGYGVFSLTPILDKSGLGMDDDGFTALMEEGYIDNTFVDYIYDEIELKNKLDDGTLVINEDNYSHFENEISEKDLMDYLGIDVPDDK